MVGNVGKYNFLVYPLLPKGNPVVGTTLDRRGLTRGTQSIRGEGEGRAAGLPGEHPDLRPGA